MLAVLLKPGPILGTLLTDGTSHPVLAPLMGVWWHVSYGHTDLPTLRTLRWDRVTHITCSMPVVSTVNTYHHFCSVYFQFTIVSTSDTPASIEGEYQLDRLHNLHRAAHTTDNETTVLGDERVSNWGRRPSTDSNHSRVNGDTMSEIALGV